MAERAWDVFRALGALVRLGLPAVCWPRQGEPARKSSVASQGGLRLQCFMYQSLSSQGATPNRSIETTAKRLGRLPSPCVERRAS